MTFGSLFAGIGGLDLGAERAGMECRWQVEIDPFCRRVLAQHWPNVKRYPDVRRVGAHNLERVDVIFGGFPCQDVSDAGKRAGIGGARSGLWGEFARIIRELQPRGVGIENVPGLLVRGLDRVLGDLAELGYDAEWRSLRAADVGAPHRRRRVFIVAYPNAVAEQLHQQWQRGGEAIDRQESRAASERRVAHASDDGREQRGPAHDHNRSDAPGHQPHGCGAAVAEPIGQRCERDARVRREARRGAEFPSRGRVEDAEFPRLEGAERAVVAGTGDGRSDADTAGPATGAWLGWPSRPGEQQRPFEPPRVLRRVESGVGVHPDGLSPGLVRHRRRALAALGNAVVPQVAEVVARHLLSILEARP